MSDELKHRVPRAIADIGGGTILASVDIAASPERVFTALSTEELTQWWGSADTYRTTAYAAELRVGGRWRTTGVGADGTEFSVGGEFLEIDAPRKLVQTWVAPWDGNHTTTITYRLDAIDGGTRLTIRHEGFAGRAESCQGHSDGWIRVAGWLSTHVAAPKPLEYFLCKLIPPRTTFPADITPAEGAIMAAHGAYVRTLIANGTGLVFGPVADPAGTWGLGVVKAENESAAREILQADPVSQSNSGFRYELYSLLSAIVR